MIHNIEKANLHPWGVIYSCLLELSSDEICAIIDLTGLQVDWNLTRDQSYSDKTRKRAYRQKIYSAYQNLFEDEQLQVAWIVANELANRDKEFTNNLNSKLTKIAWKYSYGNMPFENFANVTSPFGFILRDIINAATAPYYFFHILRCLQFGI